MYSWLGVVRLYRPITGEMEPPKQLGARGCSRTPGPRARLTIHEDSHIISEAMTTIARKLTARFS